MKENLKIIGLLFLITIFVVSVIGFIYGIFAGVWQYNPTELNYFNTKLVLTSLMSIFVFSIIIKVLIEIDNNRHLF